jgi:hypothetical protein
MTGTDQDPRVPNLHHVRRGVGEATGGGTAWAPSGAPVPPAGGSWGGWGIFAGVVLLLAGFGHVLIGLAALFDASHFDPAESDPALPIGYSAWGWIQVVLGGVLLAAGGGLLKGRRWGRLVALVFAVVSAVGALAFLPSSPAWGVLVIAMDVLVLYGLTMRSDPAARGSAP